MESRERTWIKLHSSSADPETVSLHSCRAVVGGAAGDIDDGLRTEIDMQLRNSNVVKNKVIIELICQEGIVYIIIILKGVPVTSWNVFPRMVRSSEEKLRKQFNTFLCNNCKIWTIITPTL